VSVQRGTVHLEAPGGGVWRLTLKDLPVDREVAEFLHRHPSEERPEWVRAVLAVGVWALDQADLRQWRRWIKAAEQGDTGPADGSEKAIDRLVADSRWARWLEVWRHLETRSADPAPIARQLAEELTAEVRQSLKAWAERLERRWNRRE
jgi:hypothetical protein